MTSDLRIKIQNRLELLNQKAKKSLGQNFLIDQFIVNKIVEEVKKYPKLAWVEIGPGLGSLTDDLQDQLLMVIELDRIFAEFWRSKNLVVLEMDALKFNWNNLATDLNTEIFNKTKLDRKSIKGFGLVSNLPYQISSRIVVEISTASTVDKMVLMFQKEVADRIVSLKQSSSYGFLSVIAQTFWEVKKLVFVSPNCFSPKPKVDSQVLMFERRKSKVLQKDKYVQFVKSCFAERRKKLSNKAKKMGLLSEFNDFFIEKKISLDVRAEELEPDVYIELFLFCQSKGSL